MGAVHSEHLQDWIRSGRARIAAHELTDRLMLELGRLPWALGGSGLDWRRLGGLRTSIADRTEVVAWLHAVEPGRTEETFVMFGPDEHGLVCSTVDAVLEVDYLYWRSPGPRFLCGVSDADAGALDAGCIVEWDGSEFLTARSDAPPSSTESAQQFALVMPGLLTSQPQCREDLGKVCVDPASSSLDL